MILTACRFIRSTRAKCFEIVFKGTDISIDFNQTEVNLKINMSFFRKVMEQFKFMIDRIDILSISYPRQWHWDNEICSDVQLSSAHTLVVIGDEQIPSIQLNQLNWLPKLNTIRLKNVSIDYKNQFPKLNTTSNASICKTLNRIELENCNFN